MKHTLTLTTMALALSLSATAQTTYLQPGAPEYDLLDRLETRSGSLTTDFFTTLKPTSRKGLVHFLESFNGNADNTPLTSSMDTRPSLSGIDKYNIERAISVSGEWAANGDGALNSRLPWFHTFYKKQPDFIHVKTNDFYLVVNPVIGVQGISESANGTTQTLFYSSRGAEVRGRIANKVGFYTYFTDNQEQLPSYVKQWTDAHDAIPGADYYQTPSTKTYDYLLARGYVDFEAVKDHINVTAGYDKHFIGDGYRSLFLSDFASSGATFLRLNTKIWRLNYQNLYMELTPQYQRGSDRLLPHKYATMHHLSVNATRWLNVGAFDGVIFDRRDRFDFSYMIPIIFYRQVERMNGSPDNAFLGFNFKAIALKHLQFYGQFLLDEFKAKELFAGNGWYGNKFGVQFGGKYFDAFGLKNLDLQGEINIVRPFTYSHYDSTANYTHYNQPLAHPLGAGFAEVIGIAKYQPVRNLHLSLKGIFYRQGLDSTNTNGVAITNYGSDIFQNYNHNTPVLPGDPEHGYGLTNGIKISNLTLELNASYELRENLFIDLSFTHRGRKYDGAAYPDEHDNFITGGVRLNLARRDYTFY